MTIADSSRFRKTYSYYRQQPVPERPTIVTEVSETIVRVGNVTLMDVFAARPATGTTGDVFYATDVCESFFFSGSTWFPFFGPGSLGTTPTSSGSFSLLSAASNVTASFTNDKDSWLFTMVPGSQTHSDTGYAGGNRAVWSLASPITGSSELIVVVQHSEAPTQNEQQLGIGFLTSSFPSVEVALALTLSSSGRTDLVADNDSRIESTLGLSRHSWLRLRFNTLTLTGSRAQSVDNGVSWSTMAEGGIPAGMYKWGILHTTTGPTLTSASCRILSYKLSAF